MQKIHKGEQSDLQIKKQPSTEPKSNRDIKLKPIGLLGKGLFLGAFVVLAISSIVYLWSWSVATGKAQSETFTELYFDDYLHLPSEIPPNRAYSFKFTLHNLEGRDMEYTYVVYAKFGQKRMPITTGKVFLKDKGYMTIQEVFTTRSVFPRGMIVVELVNKHQQIDFWTSGKK